MYVIILSSIIFNNMHAACNYHRGTLKNLHVIKLSALNNMYVHVRAYSLYTLYWNVVLTSLGARPDP